MAEPRVHDGQEDGVNRDGQEDGVNRDGQVNPNLVSTMARRMGLIAMARLTRTSCPRWPGGWG